MAHGTIVGLMLCDQPFPVRIILLEKPTSKRPYVIEPPVLKPFSVISELGRNFYLNVFAHWCDQKAFTIGSFLNREKLPMSPNLAAKNLRLKSTYGTWRLNSKLNFIESFVLRIFFFKRLDRNHEECFFEGLIWSTSADRPWPTRSAWCTSSRWNLSVIKTGPGSSSTPGSSWTCFRIWTRSCRRIRISCSGLGSNRPKVSEPTTSRRSFSSSTQEIRCQGSNCLPRFS